MNVWFNFKVGIVMWDRICVTKRFSRVILGCRNPNPWSFLRWLLISTHGSQGLSQKLTLFSDEFHPWPLGEGSWGGAVNRSSSWLMWWPLKCGFRCVGLQFEEPKGRDCSLSYTVCSMWPKMGLPLSDPHICVKHTCEGLADFIACFCLLQKTQT